MREEECRVEATLTDGSKVEHYVEFASGSLENPLSDEQLDAKFRDLVVPVLDESHADDLIRILRDFENQPDVKSLINAATL
jgi:2-methylcitrate dehydratase PrpD